MGSGDGTMAARNGVGSSLVDSLGRALGEAGEWNQASISPFKMTPFRRLGAAKKRTIFGRTIVCWTEGETARRGTKVPVPSY